MSKRLIDYCRQIDWTNRTETVKMTRYFMVETYLRRNGRYTVYSYQSGKHPNCRDIDNYMGWQAHTTEKIVNDDELFTVRRSYDGWNCRELSALKFQASNLPKSESTMTNAEIREYEEENYGEY